MDQKWTKYTFVCNGECDALLEFTFKDGYGWPNGVINVTCPCHSDTTLLSVEDVTINNNNEKKEDSPMNTTTTFLEARVEALEEQLKSHKNCDYWKSELGRIQSQLIETVNDSYDDDKDASEVLRYICQIIDYNPSKEVEFTATMRFTGVISVPRDEQDDFDLEQILEDAYVDINNGNVVIDNYELYDASEC